MSDVTSRRIGSAAASTPRTRPDTSAVDTPSDDKLWATLAHFGGVLWFVPSLGVYLRERQHPGRARQESKEALNWQITFTLGYVALLLVAAVVAGILLLTPVGNVAGIVWLIPMALYAVNVVLSITAGVRVNAGGAYRYPFAIRLIK